MTRDYPCCLCPAVSSDFNNDVCDKCDFIKKFKDERGWIYFARRGLGDTYKTFFKKPGKAGAHGCRMTNWRDTFQEAQEDLNALAKSKGWKEA